MIYFIQDILKVVWKSSFIIYKKMKNRFYLKESRAEVNELIFKEMFFGANYAEELMNKAKRKVDLRQLEKVVNDWSMKDVELADEMLRHKRDYKPEEFVKQFNLDISPLLYNWQRCDNVEETYDLLSIVIGKRMCEESSKYSLWV